MAARAQSLPIAIIGGGIMGRGIALALARAGHAIIVVEPKADVAAAIPALLADAARAGQTQDGAAALPEISRVRVVESLDEAVDSAALVIEAAPEDINIKKAIWARLGNACASDAVLATNTSALDIDALAAMVGHPERVLGTHWFNPAHVIPCVELVQGLATSHDTVRWVHDLLTHAGKQPVVVKNSPGFVANRIQFALVREALLCLQEGLASAEDIDTIVSSSFGVRLAALGPLANADLGGLDTYLSILNYLSGTLGPRFDPPGLLTTLVEEGHLGVKSGSGVSEYSPERSTELTQYRDEALRQLISTLRTVAPESQPKSGS